MHELSVTEALLTLTLEHAQAAQAYRVVAVNVVIGELSSVLDESVQFYWNLISSGTLAEGARLIFRRVPARFQCAACGQDYAPTGEDLACPACHGLNVRLVAGAEFCLEALEIEPRPVVDPAQEMTA